MPIMLDVDHQLRTTRAAAIGEITLADIKSHLGEEGKRSGLGYRELIDATQAKVAFGSEDVRQIVKMMEKLGRGGVLGPTAVLVSSDLAYGMLRMLEMLLGGVCLVRPFRTAQRADAEQWLASAPFAAVTPKAESSCPTHALRPQSEVLE